jgi:hypothetical protein
MSELKLGFTRPWAIRLPIVTRFLDKEYVEEFFSSGRLRLSSFNTFRNHKDEERRDQNEGRVHAEINTPNANHHILAINGQEAYVLCGGLVENPTMEASFSTRYGIRILNPLAFADAISVRIPGFVGGSQGNCIYRSATIIRKQDSTLFEPPANQESMEKWASDYDEYVARQTKEAFFIKQLKFAHQNEYRFIWFAQGYEQDELFVISPEARQYCEKYEAGS